jgi:hypothetical protein
MKPNMNLNLEGATLIAVAFLTSGGLRISFRPSSNTEREVTVESSRVPHPDFTRAKNGLAPMVGQLCEVPKRADSPVEIKGVAFKENEEGSLGAVVKAVRPYVNSLGVLPLNTPVKYVEDASPQRQMANDHVKLIEAFRVEALAYLGGKSQQGSLAFDDAAPADTITEAPAAPAGEEGEEAFDDGGAEVAAVIENMKA